ncbi:hypothetical protein RE6C_00941 [Rhodopirellula europaea 6C]|uniref:Uncharacterized protein n=1 Tax=Rhodopirellula europaea 6C TaxID=1263867 RepID=M2B9F1_9BACT|nr:hypothetical protein RE6C_00941 [Rhodopirellula europaea 6C]
MLGDSCREKYEMNLRSGCYVRPTHLVCHRGSDSTDLLAGVINLIERAMKR